MKRSLLLIFAIPVLLAAGCNNGTGPPAQSPQIMPLAIGNEWIGQVTEYNTQGNPDSTRLDTLRILKSEVVNGETWYYMNVFWIYGADTNHGWFTNRSDGLYTCDSEHFAQSYRYAKYPATPGEWVVILQNDSGPPGYWSIYGRTVDTTNLSVTVPAGIFQCDVYSIVSASQDWDVLTSVATPGEYYSPNVGLVQFGYFNPDGTHNKFATPDRTWQLVHAILH